MDFPQGSAGEHDRHRSHRFFEGDHDACYGYEDKRYPPVAPVYDPEGPPRLHGHAPGVFAPAPLSGPYDPHAPANPYYPHPHHALHFPDACSAAVPTGQFQRLPQGQLVRVCCKENQAFNLAADYNAVIMMAANAQDEAQQWIQDNSYGMRVKDNYGHSAYALVNKKTGKVIKHAKLKGQQVLLMDYHPDIRDDDILWSDSQDFGEGFKTIRSASDTLLNLTVFEGLKTVRNGSALVLDTWHKGDHQLWKMLPL